MIALAGTNSARLLALAAIVALTLGAIWPRREGGGGTPPPDWSSSFVVVYEFEEADGAGDRVNSGSGGDDCDAHAVTGTLDQDEDKMEGLYSNVADDTQNFRTGHTEPDCDEVLNAMTNGMTFGSWVKLPEWIGTNGYYYPNLNSFSYQGAYQFYWSPWGNPSKQSACQMKDDTQNLIVEDQDQFEIDEWVHVVCTFGDDADAEQVFMVDGHRKVHDLRTNWDDLAGSTGGHFNAVTNGGDGWKGFIDEQFWYGGELEAPSVCRVLSCGISGDDSTCSCNGTAWVDTGRNATAGNDCVLPKACNAATPNSSNGYVDLTVDPQFIAWWAYNDSDIDPDSDPEAVMDDISPNSRTLLTNEADKAVGASGGVGTYGPGGGDVRYTADFTSSAPSHYYLGSQTTTTAINGYSICMWVNRESDTGNAIMYYNGDRWQLRIDSGTGTVKFITKGLAVDGGMVSGQTSVGTSAWHHLCGVYEGNEFGDDLNVYYDGEQDCAATPCATANSNRLDGSVTITMGAHTDETKGFDGIIHDVAIWDRALSPTEICDSCSCGNAGLIEDRNSSNCNSCTMTAGYECQY